MSGDPPRPAIIVTCAEERRENSRSENSWDIGFFNAGAIMDEIPVPNRDVHEQMAFRNPNKSTSSVDQVILPAGAEQVSTENNWRAYLNF